MAEVASPCKDSRATKRACKKGRPKQAAERDAINQRMRELNDRFVELSELVRSLGKCSHAQTLTDQLEVHAEELDDIRRRILGTVGSR